MINSSDPRRPEREIRYTPSVICTQAQAGDDLTPDYMNILGMVFSICGLTMKLKWSSWAALYCSCISFANSRASDDTKQILSSFMLSISAVVMCYLQSPQPMTPPWASAMQELDYMNILGMVFSICGLTMKLKWSSWAVLYCSCISFANSRASDDTKQILSSFMLSISAVVTCYLQSPQPMTPPWASAMQ